MRSKKFQDIAVLLTIFISSYIFFREPFEGYITYIFFVIYFPIFVSKFGIPRQPVMIFLPLLISGLVYIYAGNNEPGQFVKVFIGFFASVLFYNYVFQLYKFDLKYLFRLYMKGAFWVSVIGIFQVISYLVGFGPGYDFGWLFNKWGVTLGGFGIRMNSVFSEPAYFAAVIAPAFYVAMYALIKRKSELFLPRKQLIVIFAAYFLTFSTLGYMGIVLALVLLLINLGFFKYVLIIGPILYFGYNAAYDNIEEFRERIDGTQQVFGEQNITSYEVHGSSFVLYNNYHVATENFKRNWLFGTGLGSHETAFNEYSLTNTQGVLKIDFNKKDANSMFLRLMSETGLYGLVFIFVFLIRCFVMKSRSADDEMWLISNAAAMIIILYLARQGHYFLNGFPFFLWLYYFTWKQNKEALFVQDEEAVAQPNSRAEPSLTPATSHSSQELKS